MSRRRIHAQLARELFAGAPFTTRTIQSLRPYICPFQALIDLIPDRARILDVGCGSGLFLGLLMRSGKVSHGVGFDVDQRALTAAQRLASAAPKSVTLQFHHIRSNQPWPPGVFDVVSMIDVMHHIPAAEQEEAIRKVAEKVKVGGLFVYKDMVKQPLWRAWANRLHDLLLAQQWIHYLELEKVEAAARTYGMRVLKKDRINLLWYGHEYLLLHRDK